MGQGPLEGGWGVGGGGWRWVGQGRLGGVFGGGRRGRWGEVRVAVDVHRLGGLLRREGFSGGSVLLI